jgi:hypothetical protein
MPNVAGSCRDTCIPGHIKHSGVQAMTEPFGIHPSLGRTPLQYSQAFGDRDPLQWDSSLLIKSGYDILRVMQALFPTL